MWGTNEEILVYLGLPGMDRLKRTYALTLYGFKNRMSKENARPWRQAPRIKISELI